MSRHVPCGMTKKHWLATRSLCVRPRMFHVSAAVRMIPQSSPLLPATPWVQKPGITYRRKKEAS